MSTEFRRKSEEERALRATGTLRMWPVAPLQRLLRFRDDTWIYPCAIGVLRYRGLAPPQLTRDPSAGRARWLRGARRGLLYVFRILERPTGVATAVVGRAVESAISRPADGYRCPVSAMRVAVAEVRAIHSQRKFRNDCLHLNGGIAAAAPSSLLKFPHRGACLHSYLVNSCLS